VNRASRWSALTAPGLFLVALATRLPGLDVFLTADEPKAWFGRSIQFLAALTRGDWAATFDSPAPGVTTMWSGALGLLLDYLRQGLPGGDVATFLMHVPFDPLEPAILPLVRLPIVLIVALAVSLTYWWGKAVLGNPGALLAALLLALDPLLLALSRVLGHDALVAVFMWLSLLAVLRAMQADRFDRRFLIASGLLAGLAFLTKYPSLFVGLFVVLILLGVHVARRQPARRVAGEWAVDVLVWGAAAGLVFGALWPAMWVDPLGRIIAIINDAVRASGSPHPKGSFFLGAAVPDPGTGFYALVTLFRTTPLLWLGWLLAGLGLLQRTAPNHRHWRRAALILLLYALLYGLLVTLGGKKQDRYILPALPALAALAAIGYARLPNLARRMALRRGVWACVVVLQAALVLPHWPYYFTYYNPVLGGGAAAVRTLMVGWGEGLDRAAAWLNTLPDAAHLRVVAWYSTTFEPYFNGQAIYKIEEEKISRTPKPGLAADYVVLYVNQVQRELPSPGALQFFRASAPAYTVTLHGIDYAWVYPSVAMEHVFTGDLRLVGQAELLGYDLRDEAGQPVASVAPDSVAYVTLYWEWHGKSPDDPIRISLVDAAGKTRGWGNYVRTVAPLPPAEWQDGMVVHDEFALAVFADTPPGDYRLAAWIERPATGETVGVFPADETRIRVRP
jgi:4-amino-4-deoxy-L-arabinose transferase-like glycosyltransferase